MILILKTGSTRANIKASQGDFENWIIEKMELEEFEYIVHYVGDYKIIPPKQNYCGIIITGSPLMVTDIELENNILCNWLFDQQKKGTLILGICFGHQLLNVINGGSVDYNFSGTIIGSKTTYLTELGKNDKLLGTLPVCFNVYKVHQQSISILPEFAEVLATDNSGIIDAVKFGKNTWGVQFHPEFNSNVTKLYIQEKQKELVDEGFDIQDLLKNVISVDYGDRILKRFKELIFEYI